MITLTYGSQTLQILKFADLKLPRVRVNPAEVSYNASGSPVLRGGNFEPKFLWTFNALLTRDQYASLQLIYSLPESARRDFSDPSILLDDQTEQIYEAVQTRALVPGTSVTNLGGAVSYFARFSAAFVRPPEPVEAGNYLRTQFALAELEVVAP